MPKLNRAKDTHFYITHGFSIRNRDVVKNYQIDDAGLKVLYQKGFRAGDSIPHDIFHSLFEEGHIFYEREESSDPSQKEAPIDLHDRIRGFFLSQEGEGYNTPKRINVFKTLVIEAFRIEDSDVRNEIFIDLAVRTRSLPSEFRNYLVSKCPGSVCRDMKIIFKLDDESFESIRSDPTQGEPPVEEMQTIETQLTHVETLVATQEPYGATCSDIVTHKGKVTGTEYFFDMGDTKALKAAIKAAHSDWGNKRVGREVAVLRADKMAASRLQADAFVKMQFAKGRTAIFVTDRNSGKISLHFEDCLVEVDGDAILKNAAAKLAAQLGVTPEAALAMLK
jgi:hypothetical protein